MPNPSRSTAGLRLSRRAALAALAAAVGGVAVGCTSRPEGRHGRRNAPAPEPTLDPDVAVAAEALANQRRVLALLEATIARHPRLEPELAPALDAHRAHAAMLSRAVPDGVTVPPSPATSSPSPSEGTSASPDDGPSAEATPRVPAKRGRAVAGVVAAERDLATSTKRHAFRAQSGGFARLLGSMGAASAQYAWFLASSGKEGS